MNSRSAGLSQEAIVCLIAAAALLALGALLLTIESGIRSSFGTDVGPWGAKLVILGAIVNTYGFWRCWPHLEPRAGLKLSGLLIALGLILFLPISYPEPVLVKVVAVAALLPGLRGAALYFGDVLPYPRHDGSISLREKAAAFSMVANGLVVIYLFSKIQTLGQTVPLGAGGTASAIAATVAVVLAVLLANSSLMAFLRRRRDLEPMEDERDVQIEQKANDVGQSVLVTAILVLVIQLGIGGVIDPSLSPNEALGLSSPLGIAHALLALLFLSHCSKNVAELWQYRRARH